MGIAVVTGASRGIGLELVRVLAARGTRVVAVCRRRSSELDALGASAVRSQFEVNALAPLFLTRALLPRMHRGAKIALITSRMGSLGDNTSGGQYGYRMSKAALNAAGVSLAHDLEPHGIAVAAVRGLLQQIDELTLATTGRFLHQDGTELPW